MTSGDPFDFDPTVRRPSAAGTVEPFTPSPQVVALPRLTAYVDETGDRGKLGGRASPIFGMAAVIVDPPAETSARAALRQLRADCNTPRDRPLSWKKDLKNHERRSHASRLFAEIEGLRVVFVVANKSMLNPGSYQENGTSFYNVIAYQTLRRVLFAAAYDYGGRRGVDVRFGHVAHHDHEDTHRYFQIKRTQGGDNFRYELITNLTWVNASQYEMSQVADVYGGFLKSAFWPDQFSNVEGSYLVRVWHQIRKATGCAVPLGLLPTPSNPWATDMEWFPCQNCQKKVTGR